MPALYPTAADFQTLEDGPPSTHCSHSADVDGAGRHRSVENELDFAIGQRTNQQSRVHRIARDDAVRQVAELAWSAMRKQSRLAWVPLRRPEHRIDALS
jgi:hypothetical protein